MVRIYQGEIFFFSFKRRSMLYVVQTKQKIKFNHLKSKLFFQKLYVQYTCPNVIFVYLIFSSKKKLQKGN